MSSENDSKIKIRKSFKISLILIFVILLLTISLGVFWIFNDGNTLDIYSKIIDNANAKLINVIDDRNDINKLSGKLGLNLSSEGALLAEEQALIDLINAINIKYDFEVDSINKKTNMTLDATYNNDNFFNLSLNNINDETYIGLGSLYDKKIKLTKEDLYLNYLNIDKEKIIVNEFVKILKNNLKDVYFSKEKETLKINDKDVYTTKHTLELTSKDIYELTLNIIDDIKNNSILVDEISVFANLDKSEIVNKLNSTRNELKENENDYFKSDIYINIITKKIERINISNKEDKISFTRQTREKYDITYTENTITSLVGNLELVDSKLKFTYKYKDDDIKVEINEKDLNINAIIDDIKINFNINNNDKTSFMFELIYEEEGVKLKLVLDGYIENIKKVSEKINNNYIDIDKMSENDYNEIYSNLMTNETLMKLIQDINSIYIDLLVGVEEDDMSSEFENPII